MAETVATIMDYPLTLNHFLERMNTIFPHVEVVSRHPDRTVQRRSYAEIYERSRKLAKALINTGIQKGERVATLSWNHATHLECYYGIPASGAVMHTLNLRLSPHDIGFIANHADDKLLIVDDVLLPLYNAFKDALPAHRLIVVPFGGAVPDGMESYEDFIAGGAGPFDYVTTDERDGCAMCYTSGTTGDPKGVIYSHRGMMLHSITSAIPDMMGVSQADCILPVVPMFHANAWGLPYTATGVGAKLVFPGPHMDAESLLELFEQEQVTFSGGVPTIWLAIIQALEAEPKRWKLVEGLRTVVGGSAAPPSLIDRFESFGIKVLHAWGMTEMSPLGTVATVKNNLLDQAKRYRATQGYAAPLVDLRATGDTGEAVPWDGKTMGELEVRGPWVASRYHDNPGASDRWTADGWFKTGDIVTIDPEGYVQITDRSKDVIKSGGEWISSVDLENAIMGHPAVKEAAVIALPHPKWDERPVACVVVKEGASLSQDELNEFLSGDFAKWQLPDALVLIDEIPKTSTGKFQKVALRDQFKDWSWDEQRQAV